ncbi:hypothetical protein [Aeromonas hydrophila]
MHHINLTVIAQTVFKSLDLENCTIDEVRDMVVNECTKAGFHDHDLIIGMVIELIESANE